VSDYPWKIERLGSYKVRCSECGDVATHRTGNALLGPEYGCGFYCAVHIQEATRYAIRQSLPLVIYLLDPPGIAGGDHPGTKLREEWPAAYRDYRRNQ